MLKQRLAVQGMARSPCASCHKGQRGTRVSFSKETCQFQGTCRRGARTFDQGASTRICYELLNFALQYHTHVHNRYLHAR